MKTIIVGSSGFIAKKIIPVLKESGREVLEVSRESKYDYLKLDLNFPEKFRYEILNKVDEVIFTAAISSPDICANKYEESYKINVISTAYFIKEALYRNCKVLFFSSDAVFGRNEEIVFFEDTETKPDTAYGKMKKEIEDMFKDNKLFKAIRLSYVLANDDKFTQYWKRCLEKDEKIEIFHPFYRNCIWIDEVINACINLLNNWEILESSFLNVTGNKLISRLEIIDQLNRFQDIDLQYDIIMKDKEFFRTRPCISNMQSLYIEEFIENYKLSFYEKIKLYMYKGEN